MRVVHREPKQILRSKSQALQYDKFENMAETKNQEWNISQVEAPPSNIAQATGNEWNVAQPATAPQASAPQPTNQQWDVAAQQWNVNQPAVIEQGDVASHQTSQQWNTAEPATQQESVPQPESGQRNVVQLEEQKSEPQPSSQQWTIDQPQGDIPPQRDIVQPLPSEKSGALQSMAPKQTMAPKEDVTPTVTEQADLQQVSKDVQKTKEQEKHPVPPQENVVQPMATKEPVTPQATVVQPMATKEPVAPQAAVVQPMAPKQPVAPQTPVVQPMAPEQPTAPQRTVVKSTTQVSMQPAKVSQQSIEQTTTQQSNVMQSSRSMAAHGNVTQPSPKPKPSQASLPPEVKPKPSTENQGALRTEGGSEIPLEEKQKGVFWLGPDLEGWIDKTKALKEEFRRQSDANEMYFYKNLPQLDVKSLNISDNASKYIYNVTDLKGVDVVNLIRCVINEYREFEAGPFFFQFAEDKKFKLELLPTATQPGNGLIKTVGRRKYYTYHDICSMLKTAGVTSKGLGIMLQKLNTSGLKSALHNQISPMNELHFMLLFEIARRLVRGPHGFSMASEPEIDQLPIGVAVARMITLFCKGNYCLNYEAVFGAGDKYNPFVDNSVVLRKQKIYALNKIFFDAESFLSHCPFGRTFGGLAFQSQVLTVTNGTAATPSISSLYPRDALMIVDSVLTGWFTLEFILRLMFSPSKLEFALTLQTWVDVCVLIPLYLMLTLERSLTIDVLNTLRVFRIFRCFKLLYDLQILTKTIKASRHHLMILLFILIIPVIVFSSLVLYSEKYWGNTDPTTENFRNVPNSMWWGLITMTTVGYGDMVPASVVDANVF
ncbi:hypothetical protein QZH41_004801 [Actinostola sp. cb2023]|nr:hypothetical protein QZH41_004801 [Actinostola sp. cb2023]